MFNISQFVCCFQVFSIPGKSSCFFGVVFFILFYFIFHLPLHAAEISYFNNKSYDQDAFAIVQIVHFEFHIAICCCYAKLLNCSFAAFQHGYQVLAHPKNIFPSTQCDWNIPLEFWIPVSINVYTHVCLGSVFWNIHSANDQIELNSIAKNNHSKW